MSRYVEIKEGEMRAFLDAKGFTEIKLPDTKEIVYGKIVAPSICLRVYTTIEGGVSRESGDDAIRFVLVRRNQANQVKVIGVNKKVLRTRNWRSNMTNRIDGWNEMLGPTCHKCGNFMVQRSGRNGDFWGCTNYPECNCTVNIKKEV
jgi:hypothetical protein